MILEAPGDRVDLELMCLSINLACNKRNAQLICESKGNKPSGRYIGNTEQTYWVYKWIDESHLINIARFSVRDIDIEVRGDYWMRNSFVRVSLQNNLPLLIIWTEPKT